MNYNKYIGLPYLSNGRTQDGIDCWGLVCLFYKQELNIELPSYSELYTDASSPEVTYVINQHKDTWTTSDSPKPGDLCLFNIYGEPAHVGVYVGDNRFLHAREGRDSVIESLSSAQWSKRFQGFYKYSQHAEVSVTGVPHPLKTQAIYDWTVAGTTVEDCANFINKKYCVSNRLAKRLIILVDGKTISRDLWSTTILQPGQTVTYKSIAEGRNATRLLLTIAVVVIAANYGVDVGTALGFTGNTATVVGSMAINMAGMALVNAIAPVRMPGQNSDPGSATGLNLFSGSSNQTNRFGAIPVVLGKMRATGVLGATPYIETLTDTSLINLLIVWGFGPLSVTDICVGTNPIENYYGTEEFGQDFPAPVTLQGYATDDATAFNKLYGRDVEQQQVGVLLVNNAEDGNPWQNVVLAQDNTTSIDIALSFPEGMRQLVISGGDAGQVREATAAVEIQSRKFNPDTNSFSAWAPRPSYAIGDYSAQTPNTSEYTDSISNVGYSSYITVGTGENETSGYVYTPLYQWYTYALSDTGEIRRFDGTATDVKLSDPSPSLLSVLKSNSYTSLLGNDANNASYSRLPEIPANGFVKLYTICNYKGQIVETINHLAQYSGYTGLSLTTQAIETFNGYVEGLPEIVQTGTKIKIASGAVYALSSNQPIAGISQTIFTAKSIAGTVVPDPYSGWSQFLKDNGVWFGSLISDFDKTTQVNFPNSGYYHIEASADDEGAVYVNNRQVVGIPKPGYASTVSNLIYLDAGVYPVRVFAKNTGGGNASVACKITYTENGGLNNLPTPDTILTFGTPGFYHKRKDAFNFVYKIRNLPQGKYEVRLRRVNDDSSEPSDELRNYNKVSLLSVTGYGNELDSLGNPQGPINSIPNTNLARTAIRLQSTSKANGTVDGVNAVVQTIALDWDRTSQTWISRPTSNPASLFGYVLTHPGNAYRINASDIYQQIDVQTLQSWHEYCDDNGFEFNSIITQTQSVMDVLRDIASAGKASPTYVDGKWSVIVDRPRSYVTQHFTPHNSWGFESTKILPRLPDAFRVTFANSAKAYQADEELIFNFGKTSATAQIFEELSLPGVTNSRQAKHLARWHLAQIKLRPEIYTINADFEYLVCNRGDLVRVSHDVPLWGTGTGRIKNKTLNTLTLTESVYLESGKTYQIRIRSNSISTVPGSDSTLLTLNAVTSSNWYDIITLTTTVPDIVEIDNLYMLGELSQESQQLVVLSVEPQDNLSARITLADYSPEIYSIDIDSDSELPSFNANISGKSIPIAQNTITQAPIITGATSSSSLAEEISRGTFQNILIVSFGNVPGLSLQAEKIQLQIVLGNTDFDSNSLFGLYEVDKSAGSVTIAGLKTQTIYKIRARYTNATGSVSGPWSDIYYTTSEGKTLNTYTVQQITVDLEDTYIVVKPPQDFEKPADFKVYEYRLFKDSGIEDFWDVEPTVENSIKVIQSQGEARFNLLDMPLPRLSEAGENYRIACRALDNSNNYSATSAFGAIVVTTIR